ncbi:MAG: L,D-transpeptidase family protein [Solirubrobacteraceae bacterium]
MRPFRLLSALVVALAALPAAGAAAAPPPALEAATAGTYPFSKGDRAVLRGAAWRVRGVARTGPGASVIVRLYRGSKVVKVVRPGVAADGGFAARFRMGKAGPVTVEVVRPQTASAAATRARRFRVWVLNPSARSGPSMLFLQQRLARMGYWPSLSGRYDYRTRWAIMAYRKVNGMSRSFGLDRAIFLRAARGAGRFAPKYKGTGRNRVEADLSRQIYVLIDAKGKVIRVVPTSSGKPSTPSDIGRFRFNRKQPGVNGVGMVNSVYYNGGEALHGYKDVPTYPASGGCLRTPTTYSRAIMGWIRLGDRIDVYR